MSNRYAIDPTGYNNQYFMAAYNSPYTNYSAPAVTPAVEKNKKKRVTPYQTLLSEQHWH